MELRAQHLAERFRLPIALLLAGHGAVHVMGFVLLWEIAEPPGLAYGDLSPSAGTSAGRVAGLVWLAVAIAFVVAARLLATDHPAWERVALPAAAASLVVLLGAVAVAPAGIVVDLAVGVAVLAGGTVGRPRWRP